MKYPFHLVAGAVAVATVLAAPDPAWAADGDDLAAIKSSIDALRKDYEARLSDLEARLKKAEAEAAAAKASAVAAQTAAREAKNEASNQAAPAPVVAAPSHVPSAANAFNPGIAGVLNGTYGAYSRDPETAAIPGFALGEEAGLGDRGFSLGESEISLSANIDPYLFGNLTVSFDGDEVEVEEAYVQSTHLGHGFTVKGGRFFSGIGYINERHAHDWSFVDASLPYRAFLNGQYGDDGVQVRWLAPTEQFLEFGAEWFRGDAFPAGGSANNGKGTYSAFVHTGGDINDASSWLIGASYLRTLASERDTDGDLFSGKDNLGIFSAVYKWAPGGNPVERNLVLSGEFFFDRQEGEFNTIPVDDDRFGWYVQGVYQFMPRWSVGARYAALGGVNADAALAGTVLDPQGHDPHATTALLEYDTSEFGRFRVQYTYDQSDLEPSNELLFQYTVIFGPHGAHRY